jgi:hypothetical protein
VRAARLGRSLKRFACCEGRTLSRVESLGNSCAGTDSKSEGGRKALWQKTRSAAPVRRTMKVIDGKIVITRIGFWPTLE